MKQKSIISLLICCMSFGMIATSCEDMLSPNSERHSYEVAQDTLYSYWGILKSLQNIGERYVVLGECRGELIEGTSYLSDSINSILNFDMEAAIDGSNRYLKASDYYHVINSCNAYLAKCDTTRVTGTLQPYMMKEYAQVEAIRAWVYLQLIQVYGEVPFYTEPLLTTDDLNAFMNSKHQVANADNLADLLEERLVAAEVIEKTYGFPSYEKYGYTATVCHSTKAMIPLNVILGDLFLTKGDTESCKKAAQYYYNYLGADMGMSKVAPGGALPNGYNFTGIQEEGADKPEYTPNASGTPWTETGAQSRTQEAVTAIPSSTNKLWGNVLRGVNELFGYDAEIRVRTDEQDTTTVASVSLTPQYDKKQLRASQYYFDLCKSQDFEVYIGSRDNALSTYNLVVDPVIGDARQYWVRDVRQTYPNGVSNTEKFVTKQNPNGGFTTVYPMIYRKSMIWLRYAEALCGAGYPSYAFAILKNGLCNNSLWYPTEDQYAVYTFGYRAHYMDQDSVMHNVLKDETAVESKDYYFATADEAWAALAAKVDTTNYETVLAYSVDSVAYHDGYTNYADEGLASSTILNYLDRREVVSNPTFLNFDFEEFNGNVSSQSIPYRTSLTQRGETKSYAMEGDDKVTVGIHSHGCGIVRFDENNSRYNYIDKVAEKAKAEYGVTLTKEDIYSGEYDDVVKKCVEDLIVDEEALELAFEGTRFFDLMRVAHRRGDASYLAKRVAKRDASLEGKLSNPKNWYFPLPAY